MSEEKKVKPGFKTSEFWLTLAAVAVGAVFASGAFGEDSPVLQTAGIAATVLGALGYTVSRGMAKKVVLFFLLPILLLGVAGCCKGHIRADAIDGSIRIVTARHDKLVATTPDVNGDGVTDDRDKADRASYLRTTELLRGVVKEALKD